MKKFLTAMSLLLATSTVVFSSDELEKELVEGGSGPSHLLVMPERTSVEGSSALGGSSFHAALPQMLHAFAEYMQQNATPSSLYNYEITTSEGHFSFHASCHKG